MPNILIPIILSLATLAGVRGEPAAENLDFFETKIRPVLVENCYPCHSASAFDKGELKAGFFLDTRAGIRKGGESGHPAVVPGKVGESQILKALRQEGPKMPPRQKLADSIILDFAKWIEMGAPDPRDGKNPVAMQPDLDIENGKKFWSFAPLKKSPVPAVKDAGWGRNPVDRFIRSRQETVGIKPNAFAHPRQLIRRAYFDLLGLPPSPEEVTVFENEAKEDFDGAYSRLLDRLLQSQHFGERWARHWLDLVRFAESNGYAFDRDRPNAYRYRDFVIRALNADMPYDQFVKLQVAGDQLDSQDPDSVAATGFLVAGPFTTQQTQKERERSRYEQLDDMVHTLGTSMLGLTIGCARCHSHKYDPVSQHDYYRLVSCFSEVGFADSGIDLQPDVYKKAKAEFDQVRAPLVAALTNFEKEHLPGRMQEWFKNRKEDPAPPKLGNWHHIGPFPSDSFDKAHDEAFPPETELDLTKTYKDGKVKWTEQPTWVDGTVHNTLTGGNSANYIYRTIESPDVQTLALSLGSDDSIKVWINSKEVLAKKIGRGAAPDQEKVDIPLKNGVNDLLIKIVNGGGPSGFYFQSSSGGPPKDVHDLLKLAADKWDEKQTKTVLDWYKTVDEEWLKLNTVVADHDKKAPKPELTMIYSAKVKGTTYDFGANTYKAFFLNRGNSDQKRGEATPGFLQVLMRNKDHEKNWVESPAEGNGKPAAKPERVALADWLADVESGAGNLLARVIVNRLWHQHFGRGIVATPSDFGTRGERPSHPELLDWLANELIANGWKLKGLHRLMMTSATYMQAGMDLPGNFEKDPENLLFWKRDVRRLEAEIIRDSLLSVSGILDENMFGAGSLDEKTARRSIYLTVKRGQLMPMLQLFDAPDAMQGIGNREESTVAPQALTLMNSPTISDWAGKFAARVRPKAEIALPEAVDAAYQTALSRKPESDEKQQMLAFIETQKQSRSTAANAEDLAFRDFCHLLLCTNEFVYVD